MTTTAYNALDLIDAQLEKAATPRPTSGNKKPIFLYLTKDHKALIRPLTDLSGCLVLMKHNKWSDDRDSRVNAICAKEIGEDCKYCEAAKTDKKLTANVSIYLPTIVWKVANQATGKPVTYKMKDENDKDVEHEIVEEERFIELSAFGKMGDVLAWFRDYMREEDEPNMTARDFIWSQSGEGTGKTFNVMPKTPKPMSAATVKLIPTLDQMRASVIEALPPVTPSGSAVTSNAQTSKKEAIDVDDEF